MKKRNLYVLIGSICFLVGAGCLYHTMVKEEGGVTVHLYAEYPYYESAEEIVDAAQLVFTGKVVGVRYEMLNIVNEDEHDSTGYNGESLPSPYTIYTIQTEQVYKGNISDTTIEIKRLGGKFDTTYYVLDEGTPIEKGGSYLFLASTYPTSYPSLVSATQGVYNLEQAQSNENNEIALNDILNLF